MAANLSLKNMCNIQHCHNCQKANAKPFSPLVGHFNSPSGVLSNVRWVLHSTSEHIPSHAARNTHTNMKCTNVDKALNNDIGSDSDAARTSHFDLGRRTTRTYCQPQISQQAVGERNLPNWSMAMILSSSSWWCILLSYAIQTFCAIDSFSFACGEDDVKEIVWVFFSPFSFFGLHNIAQTLPRWTLNRSQGFQRTVRFNFCSRHWRWTSSGHWHGVIQAPWWICRWNSLKKGVLLFLLVPKISPSSLSSSSSGRPSSWDSSPLIL